MELWYKELGFYNNPFSIKPSIYSNELLGIDTDIILEKIDSGEVVFIEGAIGKGKTSILKKIINRFGGQKRIVYYSCNRSENDIDFDKLLKGGRNIFQKIFDSTPKNMIFLLDEAQYLTQEDSKNLLNHYSTNIKSIVFVAPEYKKIKLDNGIKEIINDNVIKIKELTEEDAIGMVKKRVGDLEFVPEDMIKLIYKKSDKNPRTILKNCEEVCRFAFSQGAEKITESHIKEVL